MPARSQFLFFMSKSTTVIRSFQVTELEERIEFKGWTASAEGGYNENDGGYVKGTISTTF